MVETRSSENEESQYDKFNWFSFWILFFLSYEISDNEENLDDDHNGAQVDAEDNGPDVVGDGPDFVGYRPDVVGSQPTRVNEDGYEEFIGEDTKRANCQRKKKYYRTRNVAREMIFGSVKEQYSKLWEYSAELRRMNPGSSVIKKCFEEAASENPRFERLYICMAALNEGWKEGCRLGLWLDGCFIK
ncbi:hypothetical protein Dsin_017002 [Dipteronia sinensis]|uniref:Uncharacterized protein n=1 Tax=Dipteronia sinensis TaxID=43782 RepID=A0AAE0AER9_9ROSI|nr:hypothetical protein Dsin_017002 [Dipteronia sinensis]